MIRPLLNPLSTLANVPIRPLAFCLFAALALSGDRAAQVPSSTPRQPERLPPSTAA